MEITNIIDFIENLKLIPQDKNFEYFYRGHSDINFDLKPSVYRRNFIRNEDKIFKEMILRTPNEFINERTALEKLVKMQHYGLPTRILDLTQNPLVALYFATKEFPNKDAEVIVFKIPKDSIKYYDSDTVSILSNLSKRPIDFEISSANRTANNKAFNESSQIDMLLHEIREEKPYFRPIIEPDDFERVLAVKVKMNNSRIIKQNGSFLIFGIKALKKNPAEIPPKWVLKANNNATFFKIKGGLKKSISAELEALGINEGVLFPELENQAKHLKKIYS